MARFVVGRVAVDVALGDGFAVVDLAVVPVDEVFGGCLEGQLVNRVIDEIGWRAGKGRWYEILDPAIRETRSRKIAECGIGDSYLQPTA
jgi:hypothetical protein